MDQHQRQANGGTDELGLGEMLIAKAEPNIYFNNPFRLIQLPTRASLSQIQRKIHELEIQIQLGFVLSIDTQTLQFVRQSLSDPLQRLIYEIFWFWGDEESDDGLRKFQEGNIRSAVAIWRQRMDDFNAIHNLGVFYHSLALELELKENLQGDTVHRRWQSHWEKAWEFWVKSMSGGGDAKVFAWQGERIKRPSCE